MKRILLTALIVSACNPGREQTSPTAKMTALSSHDGNQPTNPHSSQPTPLEVVDQNGDPVILTEEEIKDPKKPGVIEKLKNVYFKVPDWAKSNRGYILAGQLLVLGGLTYVCVSNQDRCNRIPDKAAEFARNFKLFRGASATDTQGIHYSQRTFDELKEFAKKRYKNPGKHYRSVYGTYENLFQSNPLKEAMSKIVESGSKGVKTPKELLEEIDPVTILKEINPKEILASERGWFNITLKPLNTKRYRSEINYFDGVIEHGKFYNQNLDHKGKTMFVIAYLESLLEKDFLDNFFQSNPSAEDVINLYNILPANFGKAQLHKYPTGLHSFTFQGKLNDAIINHVGMLLSKGDQKSHEIATAILQKFLENKEGQVIEAFEWEAIHLNLLTRLSKIKNEKPL